MKLGDKVRASFPYAGVPACEGRIIKELVLGDKATQFLVSFEVRPRVYKNFYLTARELTILQTPVDVPATRAEVAGFLEGEVVS